MPRWLSTISSPTRTRGIIVLLKTPSKFEEFFPTFFVKKKKKKIQLLFNFEQTCTVAILEEHAMIIIYHDGLANQSSRIALSNDSVLIKIAEHYFARVVKHNLRDMPIH